MKYILAFIFSFSSLAYAADPYSFVKDFELKSVVVSGTEATITVEHKESFGQARFELVAGQACAESYPAQCYGTVVRLDDSGSTDDVVQSVFKVDLSKMYYNKGVVVTVFGPNSKKITVQY
jgi:hypothetical protein